MNKLTSLPAWQQYALAAAYILPWVAFGVLTLNVLPEAWRFQAWPPIFRAISIVLFSLFLIADVVIAFWFLFLLSQDDTTARD